jgi:uncharacterized protein YkwD
MVIANAILAISSCSSDTSEETMNITPEIKKSYIHNADELETIRLINEYRVSMGLNILTINDHISSTCEEQNRYMITNNVVNHNGFVGRSENIIKVLGALKVGENVAYNYKTPEAALNAWLKSPEHKKNIEGDFNHVGISIKKNEINGRNYYTNIFAKI